MSAVHAQACVNMTYLFAQVIKNEIFIRLGIPGSPFALWDSEMRRNLMKEVDTDVKMYPQKRNIRDSE